MRNYSRISFPLNFILRRDVGTGFLLRVLTGYWYAGNVSLARYLAVTYVGTAT